jgi:hypothetical protein
LSSSNPPTRQEEDEMEGQRLAEQVRQRQLRNQQRERAAAAQQKEVTFYHPRHGQWKELVRADFVMKHRKRNKLYSERMDGEEATIMGINEAPPRKE